jgi:serine/threonine protein kinase
MTPDGNILVRQAVLDAQKEKYHEVNIIEAAMDLVRIKIFVPQHCTFNIARYCFRYIAPVICCHSTEVSGQGKDKRRSCKQRTDNLSIKYSNSEGTSQSDADEYAKGIHMCLASEKLGLSLYAFLTQNKYCGFFVADIRKIAQETLKALAFLKKMKLTHTDLKASILCSNKAL